MFKLKNLKNAHTPVLPSTPHFFWDEVLQNNMTVKGYEEKDFNVIMDPGIMRNIIMHAIMLEEFRGEYKKPMTINSWYRPELYNDVVLIAHKYKSTKTSDHKCINSCATDTNVPVSTQNMDIWSKICRKYGVSPSIGLYKWGLHLGWRRNKVARKWDWR